MTHSDFDKTRGFLAEESGAMTIYMLVLSILMFGILGLLIDSSRTYVAHTNMQDYIDDVALAAANELDGEPDAILRAEAIITSALLDKTSSVALNKSDNFTIRDWTFLTAPPPGDHSTLNEQSLAGLTTTSDADATHVLIRADTREVPWGLLNIINGRTDPTKAQTSFKINTWAAAYLVDDQYCTQPRLVFCQPENFDPNADLQIGSQIRLEKNRGGNFAPGQYGVVTNIPDDALGTCSGLSGADQMECLLAIDTPAGQCGPNSWSFTGDPQMPVTYQDETGASVTVQVDAIDVNQGINVRFGIFDPASGNYINSPAVSVDSNQITGKPYQCTGVISEASSETQGPPVDACLYNGTCGFISNPVTLAQLEEYWDKAHPNVPYPNGITTRYELYLYEITQGLVDPQNIGNGNGPRAACSPANASSQTKANRRVIEVAFVDCGALSSPSVVQTDIPATGFAEVFLSDPVESYDYFVATFDDLVTLNAQNEGNTEDDGTSGGTQIPMSGGDIASAITKQWDKQNQKDNTNNKKNKGYKKGKLKGKPNYYDPYAAQGMRVYALANQINSGKNNQKGFNRPMLFDTQNGNEGDPDLVSVDMGNVVIIDENADSNRPDDHVGGGMIIFQWDQPVQVGSVVFFDGEEVNKIRLYKDKIDLSNLRFWRNHKHLMDSGKIDGKDKGGHGKGDVVMTVPKIGDGAHRTFYIESNPIFQDAVDKDADLQGGIQTLIYDLDGSGAIDEIAFRTPDGTLTPNLYDDILVEVVDVLDQNDAQVVRYPLISN
ncbi:MAG: pilus assembly protein TadG-related protein [Pseudomonadota bacterium]